MKLLSSRAKTRDPVLSTAICKTCSAFWIPAQGRDDKVKTRNRNLWGLQSQVDFQASVFFKVHRRLAQGFAALGVVGHDLAHGFPKAWAVVHLAQVGQLVDHHIVDLADGQMN